MISNNEEYIVLISREPTAEMIVEVRNKAGQLEYKYIPKSIIQKELLNIYNGHTKWEMLRETIGSKGMFGTGLFEYQHPVSKEWLCVSGTASIPHEKKLRLDFPNLESHCFLNAVKKIGVWFGQTINLVEEDKMPETEIEAPALSPEQEQEEIYQGIKNAETIDQLKNWRYPAFRKGQIPELQHNYEQKLQELKKQKV